ncbi:DUF397 domain-containing protein [Streptomonospora salina]|uniref:DUF397 domain-containing protein n=1 Tax=Streptomonospora salina TaxID=104205 RepID=A0A841E6N5_9ACTN|nr:DUF397 domain-containing protein [Streptomonospora salina]MBB5998482.1 hypothetical protein [Streptomonospora salina]
MTPQHDPQWHKSSYSTAQGSCVEVAEGADVLMRDTQHPELGHIGFTAESWAQFLHELKVRRD